MHYTTSGVGGVDRPRVGQSAVAFSTLRRFLRQPWHARTAGPAAGLDNRQVVCPSCSRGDHLERVAELLVAQRSAFCECRDKSRPVNAFRGQKVSRRTLLTSSSAARCSRCQPRAMSSPRASCPSKVKIDQHVCRNIGIAGGTAAGQDAPTGRQAPERALDTPSGQSRLPVRSPGADRRRLLLRALPTGARGRRDVCHRICGRYLPPGSTGGQPFPRIRTPAVHHDPDHVPTSHGALPGGRLTVGHVGQDDRANSSASAASAVCPTHDPYRCQR